MPYVELLFACILFCSLLASAFPVCSIENGQNAIYWWLPEDTEPGTVIKTLPILGNVDKDKPNVQLRLVKGTDHLRLNNRTKELILIKPIDREKGDHRLSATVECKSLLPKDPFQVNISVQITVQDVNDNTPTFSQSVYFVNITEELPMGTAVFNGLSALDADQDGPNGEVQYAIVQDGPFAQLLDIPNPWEGTVVIQRRIDFEQVKNFTVQIAAKDNGDPPRMSSCELLVAVSDVDDLNPAFTSPEFTAIIPSNMPIDSKIEILPRPIEAYDQDTMNTPVVFSLTGANAKKFRIHPELGTVQLVDVISAGDSYYLSVTAAQADRSERYSQVPLKIVVQAGSNQTVTRPLQFDTLYYTAQVTEDIPINVQILQLKASGKGFLKYSLKGDPTVSFPFTVDPLGGNISLISPLDYESVTEYLMLAEVTDGHQSAEAAVTVTVVDVNDNSPLFKSSNYFFHPQLIDNALVGKVQATDGDLSDRITYSLVNLNNLFAIGSSDGSIVISDSLGITQPSYELVVQAIDTGSPPRTATAIVKVDFGNLTQNNGALMVHKVVHEEEVQTADSGAAALVIICMGCVIGLLALLAAFLTVYICRSKGHTKPTFYKHQLPPKVIVAASTRSNTTLDDVPFQQNARPTFCGYLTDDTFPFQTTNDSPHGSQSPLDESFMDRSIKQVDFRNQGLVLDGVTSQPRPRNSSTGSDFDVPPDITTQSMDPNGSMSGSRNRPPLTVYF